jgi:LAO/AO transport system kinase
MVEVMQAAGFDFIFIETVGVGQSEVDIAALADTTAVVFVPESGDDIQALKSGIMEIADVFVVNKADREGADRLFKNLQLALEERSHVPVFKTVANARQGVGELMNWFASDHKNGRDEKKRLLLAEKAVRLARNYLLRDVDFQAFTAALGQAQNRSGFNLFRFIGDWFGKNHS